METPQEPRHTAIYLRISLDRDDDRLAVTRQREDCLALVKARRWGEPIIEYCDNSVSASIGVRPEYGRMLADVRAGRVERIVTYVADRLYRQPRDLEDLIDLCGEHDVAIVTVSGDLDLSSDVGRTVARILGAVAKGEVERKAARQRRSAKQRAELGRPWWPSRPFGFEMPDEDGEVVLRDSEADLLRGAYQAVLAGEALYAIAAQWTAAGVTTPPGKPWTGEALRSVLLKARNAGLRTYRGEVVGEGRWPAIVDRELFDAVGAILSDDRRRCGSTTGRKYLLSGIAVCGPCGRPVGSAARAKAGWPRYVCKRKGCGQVSRAIEYTDHVVLSVVAGLLSRPDAVDLFAPPAPDQTGLRQRAAALRTNLAALERKFMGGEIDLGEYERLRDGLRGNLAEVEAALLPPQTATALEGVLGAADVRAVLDGLPLARLRTIVAAVVEVTLVPVPAERSRNMVEINGRLVRFDPLSVRITPKGA